MSDDLMIKTFDETLTVYGNVMDEIRQRMAVVEHVLEESFEERLRYMAISDLCCVQFRKLCEGVAAGCVLAHGNIQATKRPDYVNEWNAHHLLNRLERLHPDFFPKPCTITGPIEQPTVEPRKGRHLTKERLTKIYHYMDGDLHVGGLSKRTLTNVAVSRETFLDFLALFSDLLFDHYITLSDDRYRIVVQMNGDDGKVHMSLQRANARPGGSLQVFGKSHLISDLDVPCGTIQSKPSG